MSNKKSKDDGPRFTGGDHLIGFEKIIHSLMMRNELINGYHGYEIRLAKRGNSGLSFGGNQMDISKRPEHIKLFLEILENAVTTKGGKIFNEAELVSIAGNKNLSESGLTPKEVFGKNLARVNAALASEYGIKEINAAYPTAIKEMTGKVETAIKAMQNPAAKAFYGTDFGRALLCDYENQYGLSVKGAFIRKYINGYYNNKFKVDYKTKKRIQAPIETYSLKNHERYLQSTKQWAKNRKMVDDRLKKTITLLLNKYDLYDNGPLYLSEINAQDMTKVQCPTGQHSVQACLVHYQPTKAHPTGLIIKRRAYCAKNPVRQNDTTIC